MAQCSDGIHNGNESGPDCGGPDCPLMCAIVRDPDGDNRKCKGSARTGHSANAHSDRTQFEVKNDCLDNPECVGFGRAGLNADGLDLEDDSAVLDA